jgi:hypothetical protein
MILYVNGCSHTAAAEAAVDHAFAEDDSRYHHLGRRAHPDNLAVSWCTHLARELKFDLTCDAESASSNDRIIRTTTDWINANTDKLADTFMIIQWTTWEREEWLHQGTWYQVNASGIDMVPQELQEKYRHYIIGIDWEQKTLDAHKKIWEFHQTLTNLEIPHLFYNSHSTFSDIQKPGQYNWGINYMHPYDRELSYNSVLKNNGFDYANPKTYHYGADGHCFWANNLLHYINNNNLIDANEIRTN